MKIKITDFVAFLAARVAAGDGYIMGATGQDPKTWKTTSWWFTQYSGKQKKQALKWREQCDRVWDCNGLAEGYYKDCTGVSINTKARYNYSGWCGENGSGLIPAAKRVPGAAVFWGNSASTIHHVAYLEKPVQAGKPEGDWYIIEARGVMYGVVRTKLYSRKPNFWGYMTKYFDYDSTGSADSAQEPASGSTSTCATLRKGDKGEDVKALQEALVAAGYALPKYGADSEFGGETLEAVKRFQEAKGLEVDGIVGPKTWAALDAAQEPASGSVSTRKTLRKGDKGDDVKALQEALVAAGYALPKYGADGDFGGETLAAVKRFQEAKGLQVDGIVGPKTWAALGA